MAYPRRYWRRYYRRYYRGKYSSYGKTRLSRNFKASANNMTQGGTFNISIHKEDFVALTNNSGTAASDTKHKEMDLKAWISGSDMHKALSNVFDQYRVEKLTIRIRPVGDSTANILNPAILFTCMDRTGFAANVPISTLRTYGSYKETQISGAKDVSPTHTCYIGASNLVEWSTYTDSKSMTSFPAVEWGVFCASLAANSNINVYVSIEIDAQIRYRGVRLDTSAVSTRV